MSVVALAVAPAEIVDNSYINIVSKRIRAYKKKVDRITALRQLTVLDKEQKELISHYDVYSSILSELTSVKNQLLIVAANDHTTSIPANSSFFVESSPVEPIAEYVVENVAEPVIEEKKEELYVAEAIAEEVVEVAATELIVENMVVDAEIKEEIVVDQPIAVEAKEEEKVVSDPDAEKKEVRRNNRYPRYHRKSGEDKQEGNGEYHPKYPRRDSNQGYRKNGIRKGEKNVNNEGWTIPKKVAYIKRDE